MALHPSLELLDAPSREVCVARRTVSNVPTQALVLLNDPIFFEAAEAFAQRLVREIPKDPARRLETAFEYTLARKPTSDESKRFLDFVRHLSSVSMPSNDAPPAVSREPALRELHAWTLVANTLFNLDEILVRP
jgi:hypothetical protein